MTTPLWTSLDAATATGGTATIDWSATGISIDTRSLEKGDLFIALAGPNFDGHDFVDAAFQAGAAAALVARRESLKERPGLVSDDTLEAMQALGAAVY